MVNKTVFSEINNDEDRGISDVIQDEFEDFLGDINEDMDGKSVKITISVTEMIEKNE